MRKLKGTAHRLKSQYIVLLATLVILAAFLSIQRESWRSVTYVIPPGVGTGEATVVIPDEIELMVGIKDTVVIKNQDTIIHEFGPFVIGPESTLTHRFRDARLFEAVCTFHLEQQMRVVINPAPWSLAFWTRNTSAE